MPRRVALFPFVLLTACAADPAGGDPDAAAGDVATPDDAPEDVGAPPDAPAAPADGPRFDVPRADVPSRTDVPASDAPRVVQGDCEAGSTRPECVCVARTQTQCYPGPLAQVNVGICRAGTARCVTPGEFGTWGACAGAVTPAAERCDGLDNDCDGTVDDGCECRPGAVRECYAGPPSTHRVGICRPGHQTCVANAGNVGSRWDVCMSGVVPQPSEVCNGFDDDCDGATDEGAGCVCMAGMTRSCYSGPSGTAGRGPCRAGTQTCMPGGAAWSACNGQRVPAVETCNGVDDDCNGRADDIPSCSPPAATCPGPLTGPAGTPVALSGGASPGASCRWAVVSRPEGAGAEGAFANPSACDTTFSSVIVGAYTVELTVTDAMGRTARCRTTVTLTGRGLRVELAWTTTGDVDLHLLHPMAAAWFSRPHDCYYANARPAWDGGAPTSPSLDVDNTSQFGPENIRIDAPVAGATYRVGVHAYSRVDAGAPSTVRIYCGGSTTPVRTLTRAVSSRSPASENDFWLVADVTPNAAGGCAVTPLDRLVPTSTARAAR